MRALRVAVALALAASATSAHETSGEDKWWRLFNLPQHQLNNNNDTLLLAHHDNNGHHHKGFNLLYLIPILIGALLVLALAAWLIVRTCRNKKKLKRSESALLPIIDPNALLLSPASREFYLQDEAETNRQLQRGDEREEADLSDFGSTLRTSESLMTSLRFDSTTGGGGVIESFHNSGRGGTPAFVASSASSGLLDSFHNTKYKNQSQSITDAQATQLYRMLHADPNVSSHRLAYQKIAFERILSSRSSPSGSASKTWLCQYEGEEIAVKVLQHYHSSSSSKASARKMKSVSSKSKNDADYRYEDLRRLVDEIQLTASLEHPNIVRFLAVAWDSMAIESLCLITEYLPEGNLSDHLQATRYPTWTHRKLRFAIGVATALEYLHSRKVPPTQSPSSSSANSSSSIGPTAILHRDVRAKNVGVSHTFEPKLVNIGAKHDYLSISPELVAAGDGNAFWTAPEVLSGRRYSEKSDIYAFGVLLSEIDTNGNLPYANTSNSEDKQQQQLRPFQVLNLVASGKLRPAFSQNCPVRIREIAAMCLCNDPLQRVNAATLTQLLESYDKTLAQ